jgi:hypothetical protein
MTPGAQAWRARPVLPVAIAMLMAFAGPGSAWAAAPRPPEPSLEQLDAEFRAAAADLVRRSRLAGNEDLAVLIDRWNLPAAAGRQCALLIPAAIDRPACAATIEAESIWDDFIAARKARAARVFAHSIWEAARHDRSPSRAELTRPAEEQPVGLEQRSCEAIRLLYLTLRDDPDHVRGREAAGWVRRGDRWEWPAAARRLDRGDAYDPAFGWIAKGRLARVRAGERYVGGRWIRDDEDTPPADIARGRQFDSDHWEIVSTAVRPATAELAVMLEATRLIWLQVFGGFALEPADLERRLAGRGRLLPQTPHSAILCGSRNQYVSELHRLEPRIAISDGLYWQPTRTIWCYAAPALPVSQTVRHEATHQLFAESRPDIVRMRSEPGLRCGFWAVEAAALYAESITEAPFGWTLGGRDRGRCPAARQWVIAGEFFLPLADLAALGRDDFQADPRIDRLYDQCGGLADFFMNAHGGRYREPFVEYLVRVYSGTAQPDSLFRLCGRSGPELDTEYREFITAASEPE